MFEQVSKKKLTSFTLLGAAIALSGILSGCVGGTTFGTGVTQEEQLLQDLEGMVSMGSKRKRKRINYAARPDLVLPGDQAALPQPVEEEASTSNADWPESPEQRLARIRGEAEEADPRSGEVSVEELTRKKEGISVTRVQKPRYDTDRDGHAAIHELEDGTYKNARAAKAQLAYSKGPNRKYLTEPPVEYRTPVDSAPIGDLGISEEEKHRREEKKRAQQKQEDSGMWTGG